MTLSTLHTRRWLSLAALSLAVTIAVIPVYLSQKIHRRMVNEEQAKMQLWASATEAIAGDDEAAPVAVLLSVISDNKSIPILLVAENDSILSFNNIVIPPSADTTALLQRKLNVFKKQHPPIPIALGQGRVQYLYYGNSSTLQELLVFPIVQIVAFLFFIAILATAWWMTVRVAQNLLWVGLSRETAHQLGTPISSLMAWVELLKAGDADPMICDEMTKDLARLKHISHRFQKIGDTSGTEVIDLRRIVEETTDYMRQRISRGVTLFLSLPSEPVCVRVNTDLMGWVIENLLKNAVDAMDGKGEITLRIEQKSRFALLDVTDTGKGMSVSTRRKIFKAGFSTKRNGWGLGLSLARRIVESSRRGRIFVLRTEPQRGTTFRIKLPLA